MPQNNNNDNNNNDNKWNRTIDHSSSLWSDWKFIYDWQRENLPRKNEKFIIYDLIKFCVLIINIYSIYKLYIIKLKLIKLFI